MTSELFAEDRAALLQLLAELSSEEWSLATDCASWTVRDVASHLVGVDLANVSRRRDGFAGVAPHPGEGIGAFVNRINDEWMQAARRLSPRVVRDLLAVVCPPLFDHLASLDQMQLGRPVSWAGPEPAPVWLDVAREFTERWHHQQHIRDAVGRPGQVSRRFLYPVLAAFAHALPVPFGGVEAPVGTTALLRVTDDAGGDWSVRRDADRWRLYEGAPESPTSVASLDPRTAWRLYTKGITPDQAATRAALSGDSRLANTLMRAVAIIA